MVQVDKVTAARIAIYRPDDISVETFDWAVSIEPVIQLLTHLGLEPTLPQRRLHPDWRDPTKDSGSLIYDVIEVPADQFFENEQRLLSMGFESWPEDEDEASQLYGSELDQ